MNVYDYEKQKIQMYEKFKKFLLMEDEVFKEQYVNSLYTVDDTYDISPTKSMTGTRIKDFTEMYFSFKNVTWILKEANNSSVTSFADQAMFNIGMECFSTCGLHIMQYLNDIDMSYKDDKNLTETDKQTIKQFIKDKKQEISEVHEAFKKYKKLAG